jgi:hypothetical protein
MVVNGGVFEAVDKLPLIQLNPVARRLASLNASHALGNSADSSGVNVPASFLSESSKKRSRMSFAVATKLCLSHVGWWRKSNSYEAMRMRRSPKVPLPERQRCRTIPPCRRNPTLPELKVGDKIRVSMHGGRIVEAIIKAIID